MSATLVAAVASGDAAALARAISLAEAGGREGEEVVAALFRKTGRALVIGVTGPPGVGKSSLVNGLVGFYRQKGRSVGVVAVDPSSSFSGGAILGDRIRMQEHALDPEVFIRSMASRGQFGGLSRATRDAIDLIDASGRDPILVETVGVGQDEIDVVRIADTVLVVLSPGQGDDIQAIKAGILEIADLFVINKADHPGANRLESDLEAMLSLGEARAWRPPVLRTVATAGTGIPEVAGAIARHQARLREGHGLETRRRAGLRTRLLEILRARALARLVTGDLGAETLASYEERLERREIDPYSAAGEILGGSASGGGPAGTRLDHIGIAVTSLRDRLPFYEGLLGLAAAGIEEVPGEKVRLALLPAGRTRVELLEPTGADSPIARFLEKRGGGIHHICFEVDDLEPLLAKLKAAGLTIAGAEGRPGAEGSRIAFVHPRETGGVLVELRQSAREGRTAGD